VSTLYRLALIVIVCAVALGAALQLLPAQDKAGTAQKWEYKCVPAEATFTKTEQISDFGKSLSAYGSEGWELAWLIPAEQARSYQIAVF